LPFWEKCLWRSSLSLLHELIPNVDSVAFLVNPNNAVAELDASDVQAAAAGALGQKLIIVNAGTEVEIVAALMTIAEQRIGGRKLGQQYQPFFDQRSGRYRRSITARREAANSSARMYFASHDRVGATGA
jgi:hypothetical protein